MVRIKLDRETIDKLRGIKETTVLCDEDGKVFALASPSTETQLQPQISEEEMQRRINNPGKRYTTEEVLKYLESL